jgi:hypothetical protein
VSEHAILVDGQVVPVDLMEWAKQFSSADRRVAFTELPGAEISTVFLGLNHQFNPRLAPLWFETMVFGGEFDQEMDRYTTLEEAMQGHERMVARVRDVLGKAGDHAS